MWGEYENWLVWAEAMLASNDPVERLVYGAGVKIAVEGALAVVVVSVFTVLIQGVNYLVSLPSYDFWLPALGVQGVTFALIFGCVFCEFVTPADES